MPKAILQNALQIPPPDLVTEGGSSVDKVEVPSIHRLEESLAPELLQKRFVVSEKPKIWDDRLVRDDEIPVVDGAVDGRLESLFEVRDEVPRVASEDLVTSLTAENNLTAFARKQRHHVLRKRSHRANANIPRRWWRHSDPHFR